MHDTFQRPTSSTRKRRPTIVCIDDDPGISCAIALMLSKFDVEVVPAFTGQQGVWQAVRKNPDLLITDCRMPQGDGDLVLECLKPLWKARYVPVVVLTGLRDPQLDRRMRRLGAVGYLLKPVSTAQLLAEIGKHVVLRERDEYAEHAP